MSIRSIAFVFAAVLAIASPLAAHAATPLPGQPGADTSLGQELRSQPYTDAERQAITRSATSMIEHAKPMTVAHIIERHGDSVFN